MPPDLTLKGLHFATWLIDVSGVTLKINNDYFPTHHSLTVVSHANGEQNLYTGINLLIHSEHTTMVQHIS